GPGRIDVGPHTCTNASQQRCSVCCTFRRVNCYEICTERVCKNLPPQRALRTATRHANFVDGSEPGVAHQAKHVFDSKRDAFENRSCQMRLAVTRSQSDPCAAC